jgi:hypothetical protein
MSQQWFLFKGATNEQLGPLAFDEFRAAASQLISSEIATCFAWQSGWPDWRPLDEVAAEFKELKIQAPPSPPVRLASAAAKRGKTNKDEERRIHERFDADMGAVILSKGKVYRTKTENISAGGIRLKEQLPADISGDASVIITRGEEHFKARVKEVKKDRFEFEDLKAQSREILKDWLDHLAESKKKSA